MKKYLFTIFTLALVISCKTDPNKDVDEGFIIENKYYSKEIGWTIEIPKGWNITEREVSQEIEDKGLKLLKETNGSEFDVSGLKQLISFNKDKFHSFSATSEKYDIQLYGDYEENKKFVKELITNAFDGYGIKYDTVSSIQEIDNLEFDLFQIRLYNEEEKTILYQELYSRYINGFDFGVNINYINDDEKKELLEVWKKSKFE